MLTDELSTYYLEGQPRKTYIVLYIMESESDITPTRDTKQTFV